MKSLASTLAILFMLALPQASQAVAKGGIEVVGTAYVAAGYWNGWAPLYGFPQASQHTPHNASDPYDLLYATLITSDSRIPVRFGANKSFSSYRYGELYEGLCMSYIGTQVYHMTFDVSTTDFGFWIGSDRMRLELRDAWDSSKLYWYSNGPWHGVPQHYEIDTPGIWGYEFRLVYVPVPEPSTALSLTFSILALYGWRRVDRRSTKG